MTTQREKVSLLGFKDNTTVVFDRDSVRIYFGKNDLINYCNDGMEHRFDKDKINDSTVLFILGNGDSITFPNKNVPDTLVQGKDTLHLNPLEYIRFLKLLNTSNDTTILIKDSLVYKSDTVQYYYELDSSIIHPVDEQNFQSSYAMALGGITEGLLKKGKAKIFDVTENNFVEYIIIKHTINFIGCMSGDIEMYLPNDKLFYRREEWIK